MKPHSLIFAFNLVFAVPLATGFLLNHEKPGVAFQRRVLSSSEDELQTSQTVEADNLKDELFAVIPKRPFGAPATNLTTEPETRDRIDEIVTALEPLTPYESLINSTDGVEALGGEWQLLYSDASEITRIVKLPLGFSLGPVFQPIDTSDGRFENQALIKHRLFLLSGHTRVMANFWLANVGDVNRAGVVNQGLRANVKFEKVIFTLRRLLFLPTFGKIRKTAIPNGPSEQKGVIPCIDVTYLDEDVRISRGGDGSLFILVRVDGKYGRIAPMPMLQKDASEIVVDKDAPTYDASVDILPSGSRD